MDLGLELGFSGQIWAILLEIGPICLDLGHFAKIWAILLGFGLFGRIWVRIGPKGEQGRIHGRTVADSWAGAVKRKPPGIQQCDGRTDLPTDRHGKV